MDVDVRLGGRVPILDDETTRSISIAKREVDAEPFRRGVERKPVGEVIFLLVQHAQTDGSLSHRAVDFHHNGRLGGGGKTEGELGGIRPGDPGWRNGHCPAGGIDHGAVGRERKGAGIDGEGDRAETSSRDPGEGEILSMIDDRVGELLDVMDRRGHDALIQFAEDGMGVDDVGRQRIIDEQTEVVGERIIGPLRIELEMGAIFGLIEDGSGAKGKAGSGFGEEGEDKVGVLGGGHFGIDQQPVVEEG